MVAAITIFQANIEAKYVDPQSTYTARVLWGLNDLVSNTSEVVVLEWLPSTNTGNIDVLSLQIIGTTILRKLSAFPTRAYELVRRCFQCATSMCRCRRKSMRGVGTKVPLLWCDGVTWNMYIHTIGWLCVPRSPFPRNPVIFKPQYGVNRCQNDNVMVPTNGGAQQPDIHAYASNCQWRTMPHGPWRAMVIIILCPWHARSCPWMHTACKVGFRIPEACWSSCGHGNGIHWLWMHFLNNHIYEHSASKQPSWASQSCGPNVCQLFYQNLQHWPSTMLSLNGSKSTRDVLLACLLACVHVHVHSLFQGSCTSDRCLGKFWATIGQIIVLWIFRFFLN